jgi:hypothetical protein
MQVNRITYKLSGRLGNHLQLWACARTLSLRYGWEFLYRPIVHAEGFSLTQAYHGKEAALLTLAVAHAFGRVVRLYSHDWDESGFLSGRANSVLRAQAGKLLMLNWGGIFRDLTEFRPRLIGELLTNHEAAVPRFPDQSAVGIHIRRTDAEYPMPLTYYTNAVRRAEAELGRKPILHLYSDGNLEELRGELRSHLPSHEIVLHRGGVVEDLLGLARFSQIIISMSWFSYWSAYLSHGARIYCPSEFQYYPHWLPVDP